MKPAAAMYPAMQVPSRNRYGNGMSVTGWNRNPEFPRLGGQLVVRRRRCRGNGNRDADEPLLSHVQLEEQVNGQFVPASRNQADGSYTLSNLTPGTYIVEAAIVNPEPTSGVSGGQTVLASLPRTITVTNSDQTGIDFGLTLPATPHDNRNFPQTGYRIDNDLIWNYFQARGGVNTFGYPVSRTFPFLPASS